MTYVGAVDRGVKPEAAFAGHAWATQLWDPDYRDVSAKLRCLGRRRRSRIKSGRDPEAMASVLVSGARHVMLKACVPHEAHFNGFAQQQPTGTVGVARREP